MPSSYYTHASGKPANQTRGLASEVRYELDSIAASFALLPSPTALASGSINYALDTGLTNAYVVSVSSAVTAYSDGFSFFFKPLNNNSGASTLNVNTLGLKAIVRPDGTAVQLNDIVANQILKLTYNSSYNGFQLDTDISYANQAAASASAAAASAGSAAASAAATAGAIVTERSAAATLTNKTLAAPVITGGASISGNVSVAGTVSGASSYYAGSTGYILGQGSEGVIFANATDVTLRTPSGGNINFQGGGTTHGRFDAGGNWLVGANGGSSHRLVKAGAPENTPILQIDNNTYESFVSYAVSNNGFNGAAAAGKFGKNTTTSRSINAAGTINASGADYAEYEQNNGTRFVKGQVVGFKEDGTLTDVYADAIRFGVKSTNPSLVGGDAWGTDKEVGKRPEEPQFAAPEYQGPQDPGTAPIEPVRQTLPEDTSDKNKTKVFKDFANAHTTWVAANAEHEKLAYEYRAAQADHSTRVKIAKNLFDTATYPEYQRALTAFEARLEAERQTVDRIAYCGKVPVAVYDATPGGYIIADKDSDGKIIGEFVADPDFSQYKKAVGRVNRIMDAEASAHLAEAINGTDPEQFVGMAEIAVIVH